MPTVALCFEFKTDGKLGHSAVGDVLRLSHALRHPVFDREEILLFTTFPERILAGLFKDNVKVQTIEVESKESARGKVDPTRIAALVANAPNPTRVVHPFIGCEPNRCHLREIVKRDPVRLNDATSISRCRIDMSTPKTSCMFHSKWSLTNDEACRANCLGVTIRNEASASDLNTPKWLPSVIRSVCQELGWTYCWIGGKDKPPTIVGETLPVEECYLFGDTPLLEQTRQIKSRVRAVTGWNSGGLDLAASGGLHMLRGGEHQRLCNWGTGYNSYLATGCHIGLEPATGKEDKADEFRKEVYEKSLKTFLANIETLPNGQHVILPQESPLYPPDNMHELLRLHHVPWTENTNPPSWWQS